MFWRWRDFDNLFSMKNWSRIIFLQTPSIPPNHTSVDFLFSLEHLWSVRNLWTRNVSNLCMDLAFHDFLSHVLANSLSLSSFSFLNYKNSHFLSLSFFLSQLPLKSISLCLNSSSLFQQRINLKCFFLLFSSKTNHTSNLVPPNLRQVITNM